MASPGSEPSSLKRSFEQSGLDDGQDLSGDPTIEGRKLVHLARTAEEEPQRISLTSLPVELLIDIACYLSTEELLSFRLTNRFIEAAIFNDFAAYYFAKKQFMLTYESLQCLVDISLHPKLSTVLQHVIISLDKYEYSTANSRFTLGTTSTSKYFLGFYNQTALLESGRHRDLLAQAFRNLSNLKTVGLRDYNNGRRWRDGEGAEWRAYGASTVLKETGVSLLRAGPNQDHNTFAGGGKCSGFSAMAFAALLQALNNSGARPQSIEILLRDPSHGLPHHAFHIPRFLEPTTAPVLSSLKTLLLTVRFLDWDSTPLHLDEDTATLYGIRNFLRLTTNLTHLRLNFRRPQTLEGHGFLEWLAASDATLILPQLEELDLGMMDIRRRVAPRLVKRFAGTLKALSFWKVRFFKGDPHEDDEDDEDDEGDEDGISSDPDEDEASDQNLWADFLVKLPAYVPGLERISVGCLQQTLESHVQHVQLKVARKKGSSRAPDVREYTRQDMRDLTKFRDLLRSELQPDRLEPPPARTQSDESAEEDEDSDELGSGSDDDE